MHRLSSQGREGRSAGAGSNLDWRDSQRAGPAGGDRFSQRIHCSLPRSSERPDEGWKGSLRTTGEGNGRQNVPFVGRRSVQPVTFREIEEARYSNISLMPEGLDQLVETRRDREPCGVSKGFQAADEFCDNWRGGTARDTTTPRDPFAWLACVRTEEHRSGRRNRVSR